jgi:hypothetical protein
MGPPHDLEATRLKGYSEEKAVNLSEGREIPLLGRIMDEVDEMDGMDDA